MHPKQMKQEGSHDVPISNKYQHGKPDDVSAQTAEEYRLHSDNLFKCHRKVNRQKPFRGNDQGRCLRSGFIAFEEPVVLPKCVEIDPSPFRPFLGETVQTKPVMDVTIEETKHVMDVTMVEIKLVVDVTTVETKPVMDVAIE
ncbi:hypothetical protein Btru_030974 [Bulinus truncatus]|nr:hypothetical protein Btru_030974 [Bulinus truncatus]